MYLLRTSDDDLQIEHCKHEIKNTLNKKNVPVMSSKSLQR